MVREAARKAQEKVKEKTRKMLYQNMPPASEISLPRSSKNHIQNKLQDRNTQEQINHIAKRVKTICTTPEISNKRTFKPFRTSLSGANTPRNAAAKPKTA